MNYKTTNVVWHQSRSISIKIATVITIDFDRFIIKWHLWKRNPKIITDFILNYIDKIRIVEAH